MKRLDKAEGEPPFKRRSTRFSRKREQSRGSERLEAFSDAVIAIVLTVLSVQLFEIDTHALQQDGIAKVLLHEWPSLVAFVLTFLVVGQIWITHHNLWRYIEKVDQVLLVINLSLLLFVAIIPLPARLLAEELKSTNVVDQQAAAACYAATALGQAVLFNLCLWWAHRRRLLSDAVNEDLYRAIRRRYLFGPSIYLFALLVVLISPWISIISYLGVVGLYVWPGAGDLPSEDADTSL
ncbi:TMEM175 family protein [Nostoc sp.]|uniref:TMEM175 family protein n=1 Tax=Nostoc sp. TaxID=1180 RepID=UPI002FF55066